MVMNRARMEMVWERHGGRCWVVMNVLFHSIHMTSPACGVKPLPVERWGGGEVFIEMERIVIFFVIECESTYW